MILILHILIFSLGKLIKMQTHYRQGWEFDLYTVSSTFRSFLSWKKIDRDRIDLVDFSITKNDWLERKKLVLSMFLTGSPPFYAKRSNRSRWSSIFFKLDGIDSLSLIFEKDRFVRVGD